MALSKSYSRKRKYYYKLPNENPEFKLFLNDFQKTTYSFYFQNTLLTLLHLVLIKRFLNMSNVDTKIQRLLIPSLLSEQFQSFTKFPPFSSLGEKIYKIKIIPWYVTQFSCLVMVPLLKDFFWYYSHPILCHLATVLPILFTLNWNLVLFSCHENHQKRSFLWWEGSFCPDIKSIIILLNGVCRNDCLYYSGLCTTRNALSSVITVNGYIKLLEHMHFFQDILCQYTIYTPTCGYLRYQPFIISLLPFIFVLSCKPNTRVRFSVSWWFGSEKHFCFFDYSESRSATNPCRIQ